MKIGIRGKLLTAFLIIVLYALLFAWQSDRSNRQVQSAILGIASSVTPAVQGLGELQANTMHLLEALASYQMIRASAAGPEDLELQREYQEAVEIQ
ncbi:MAG: hypothetical protein J5J00_08440, partial [Deltaproteobacteria bacterium]|nr:hypothetical protein [Deltaproteobacteria bacterium]